MDIRQEEYILSILGEDNALQQEIALSTAVVEEGVVSISKDISEIAKYIREKIASGDKGGLGLSDNSSADSIAVAVAADAAASMSLVSTINFTNELLMDFATNRDNTLVRSINALTAAINRNIKVLSSKKTAHDIQGGVIAPTASAADTSSKDPITVASAAIRNIIAAVKTVDKEYAWKARLVRRSFSKMGVQFKKVFNEDLLNRAADSEKFAKFLGGYVSAINAVDTKTMKKKTNTLIWTFERFSEMNLSGQNIKNAPEIALLIANLSDSAKKFFNNITLTVFPSKKRIQRMLDSIEMVVRGMNDIGKNTNIANIRKAANTLDLISGSILKFSRNVALASIGFIIINPLVRLFGKIADYLVNVYDNIGRKGKNAKKGAAALAWMGIGILTFTGFVVASAALVMLVNPVVLLATIAISILSIWALTKMYDFTGRNAGRIMRGVGAVALIALGNLAIVASLMIISKAKFDWQNIGFTLLLTAGLVGLYYLVGKIAGHVVVGAIAVAAIGLSLMFLGFSLDKVAKTLHQNGSVVWKLPVLVGSLALLYLGIGQPEIAAFVLLGAIVVAAIGASLWLLSKPLDIISEVYKKNTGILWKLPTMLLTLGLAYAGLGIASPFIALGAAAMVPVMGSLWVFANAIEKILKTEIDVSSVNQLTNTIKATVAGYLGVARQIKLTDAPKIALMHLVSTGIRRFARGLNYWKERMGDWTEQDTKNISEVLPAIISAFVLGTNPDYISQKYGIKVTSKDIRRGIRSTMAIGRNLRKLSRGIKAWQEMDLSPEEAEKISTNISTIMSILPYTMAKVGKFYDKETADESATQKYNNGETYTRKELRLGIRFTRRIGNVLSVLAEGVKYWKESKLDEKDMEAINTNISTLMGALPYTIAKVGKFHDKKNAEESAQLKYNNGETYTRRELRLGIRYTRKIGRILESLANGVKYWKDAKITETDTDAINLNVGNILKTLPGILADVGKADGQSKMSWLGRVFTKSDVERGVEYAESFGSIIEGLANGVKYWKDVTFKDGEVQAIEANIKSIITALPRIFAELGKDSKNKDSVWGMFVNDSKKGMALIESLNKSMGQTADIVLKFNSVPDLALKAKTIGTGIHDMFSGLNTGLSMLTRDKIDLFDKFIDPFKRFTDVLISFTKSLNEVGRIDFENIKELAEEATNYEIAKADAEHERKNKPAGGGGIGGLWDSMTGGGNDNKNATKDATKPAAAPKKDQTTELMTKLTDAMEKLTNKVSTLSDKVSAIDSKIATSGGAIKVVMQ